jgi:hypothetical protein
MHRDDVILHYLRDRMPGYPFDPTIDLDFVGELVDDFPDTNRLVEIKAFRWYYDNRPAHRVSNLRLALRRWIARSSSPRR